MLHSEFRGSRRTSDGFLAGQAAAAKFAGLPEGMDRYDLIHLVKDAGRCIGLSRRQIDHLEFLIRYTRDQDWTAGERPVVYLSVLSTARERGVCERQVRNLEYGLSEAGVLTWNDSGNHRRTGARSKDGKIVFAYGADLSPLAERIEELEQHREALRLEAKAWDRERRAISSLKRSVRAMTARGIEDGLINADDARWDDKTAILDYRVRAETPLPRMREVAGKLRLLSDELQALVSCGWRKETSPKAEVLCRHIDTTNNSLFDKSNTCTAHGGDQGADAPCGATFGLREGVERPGEAEPPGGAVSATAGDDDRKVRGWVGSPGRGMPLDPEFDGPPRTPPEGGRSRGKAAEPPGLFPSPRQAWRADTGVQHIALNHLIAVTGGRFLAAMPMTAQPTWDDVVVTARDLAPLMGIGERLLVQAAGLMGWQAVAVCIVLIDRRHAGVANPILSAGGYLRGCMEKARLDKLHLHASVFGALNGPDAGEG